MKREQIPLTPEWLRRLRDAKAEAGAEIDAERVAKATDLAARLGLQIGPRPGTPAERQP